ncbi:hypothetical protein DSO57_1014215 [Entomophthora muscae]|uniref:Uncharacterized protein n=1 Tax=Entomophthora muscae TaxID=34485 RepID=A0ACC2U4V1_9FUNG|nr:hypothetical protein DSO57_1014215 [Entomophthora muscae]
MNLELRTALGVIVLLVTACLDALGYNIQRRDHCKNNASSKPRHECYRKYWHLGLYIYIGSLVIGTNIGLQLINAHCVAPLTTSSLIFNVIFARYLVGSRITRRDLVGTAIIIFAILSLLAVTVFAPTREDKVDFHVKELKALFNTTTFLRNLAILISVLGGLCASETIIFAKSGATILQAIYYGDWSSLDGFSALIVSGIFLTGTISAILSQRRPKACRQCIGWTHLLQRLQCLCSI